MSYAITTWVCTKMGRPTPANTEAERIKYLKIDLAILVVAILGLALVEVLRKFILSEGSYTTGKLIVWGAILPIVLTHIVIHGKDFAARMRGLC